MIARNRNMLTDITVPPAQPTGVPAGAYPGEFVGAEPTPPNEEKGYPAGIKWTWKITSGEFAGRLASRITGARPSAKNACGKILNALVGKTVGEGESIKLTDYVGRKYTLIVQAAENGGTRVETVALVNG
jgi:hypothetical protein